MSDRREALKRRLARSSENVEDRGGKKDWKGIFKPNLEGVSYWRPGKGQHMIDIVPYIAGKYDPDQETSAGDETYVLDLWVHKGIGPSGSSSYICPSKNYGKPCPICEDLAERFNDESIPEDERKKYWKDNRAIRTVVYNVIVRDSAEEEEKGIQVLVGAHYHFEKNFIAQAKIPSRSGEDRFILFFDTVEGQTICFNRTGIGATDTGYDGFKFIDREDADGEPYEIEEELIEKANPLDELIHRASYDEIKIDYYGEEVDEEEEQENQEESVEEEKQEEVATEKKVEKKTKKKAEKKEEESEEDAISRRRAARRGKSAKKEEPENPCPAGHVFGTDCDVFPDDCTSCSKFRECDAEWDRLNPNE